MGLLYALDDRLLVYGFETNTGVKFVAVVDMRGRKLNGLEESLADAVGGAKSKGKTTGATAGMVGLKEGDVKIVRGLSAKSGTSIGVLTCWLLGIQSHAGSICAAAAKPLLRPG